MKWEDRDESQNVEDRRDESPISGGSNIGSIIFLGSIIRPLLRTKLGWILIGIGVLMYISGFNPLKLLDSTSNNAPTVANKALDDKHAKFISTILGDTERIWQEIFKNQYNENYVPPQLVLYRGSTRSACGQAQAQVGPFYCPQDAKVYMDLNFLDELVSSHGGGGDFAEAYVLSHEVGHHIQKLQGILDKVQRYNASGASEQQQNAIQVRVELQADCYAGLWAHHAQKRYSMLEPGDIDEALNTASSIGDDVLQKESQGYVVPDSFTHGSAAQRSEWFRRGFEIGTLEACDTFK
jgi:uncharacterized protein